MSDGRKRLSGYQYKKIGKEKRKKEDELLEKTKTLHTFFRPITQGDEKNINKPILEAHVQTTTRSKICSTSSHGSSTTSEQSQKQEIALSKLTTEDANGLGLGSLATEGFRNWSNVNKILSGHKNSKEHLQCQIALIKRSRTEGRVDSDLCTQIKNEIEYWRNVLKRVIVAVKALANRGLPFRGSSERFGSLRNGNFMMILETIAEFDPFLSTHIAQCGNPCSRKTSYLSSTTCNEFINLIASKVKNTIVSEIQAAKYFSIAVDSTPDITHIDQLSFIIRYVKEDGARSNAFLVCYHAWTQIEELETAVTSILASFKIDIGNCKRQSYDNASNMSGIYTGLQARLK
ncbi:unnamed protein product [Lasius platythorax]|uniref:DUF4371 domain-containing protein n=1 Tax=Lasius platythorax TaxID=488582 RepID=A0AAV2NGG4_9HYME